MASSATVVAGNDILAAELNNLRKDVIESQLVYAADAQASDTYVITVDAQYTAYVTGSAFLVKFNTKNTGTATLNINAIGAKTIVDINGETLQDGAIRAGMIAWVEYDGTNIRLLNESKKSRLIAASTSDVSVNNTVTETTVATMTVLANTLSTGNCIHLRINAKYDNSGTSDTLTVRVKYGATTIVSPVIGATASARDAYGYIDVFLFAAAATNAQEVEYIHRFQTVYNGTWTSGEVSTFIETTGTAAEDSTADKTLAVTVQWSAANAGSTFRLDNYFAEIKAL